MNTTPYDNLPRQEQTLKLLCYYAHIGDNVSAFELNEYAGDEGLDMHEISATAKILHDKGMLQYGEYDWQILDFSYSIKAEHYFPVLQLLYTERPEWQRQFEKSLPTDRSYFKTMQTMMLLTLKGRTKDIASKWFTIDMIPYLLPIATDPLLAQMLLRMPPQLFPLFFDNLLVYLFEHDIVDTENVLPRLLNGLQLPQAEATELKEALALYRYFSHGEYTPAARTPDTLFGLLLEAVHAAYSEQYAQAVSYFEAAMKIQNKRAKEKNLLHGMMNSYVFIMSCVREASSESFSKIQQFLKKKTVEKENSLLPARIMGCCFNDVERRLPRFLEDNLLRKDSTRAAQCFGFLFARYFKSEQYASLEAEEYIPRQSILRHELSAFLPLTDDEREILKQQYGNAPLLASIHQKETWELVLEDLLKEELELNNGEVPQNNRRMAYIIRHGRYVETREQTILKSGQWSSGKVIASSRYQEGKMEFMDEMDKKIWTRWRSCRNYQLYPEDVLPKAVGSNRIFTGTYAPFEPVCVTEEKPYIVVEKGEKGFNISSNYSIKGTEQRFNGKDCIIVQKDSTHYTVIRIQGRQRRYYDQLLALREFPATAEEKLQDFFSKVGKVVEVHSPIIKGSSSLKMIDGKSTICLQVHPQEEIFHVQMYAKPMPEGTSLQRPGEGMGLIVDENKGIRYQVKRHLTKEQSNYEALVNYLEEGFGINVTDYAFDLTPKNMLTLLDYIRPLSETYVVEWPEGEKIRLRKTVSPFNWDISLKSNGNWLEIEGDVQLEDDTIVSMAQLLEYIGQSRSKFIRLNETDYLRLSDNLRKQLERLESVSVKNHGKVQISNFQAGLLGDDVLNGEVTIKHDSHLDAMRQKIYDSRQLTIKTPAKLKADLRDYQLDGFRWIARLNNWGAGACLADDMGLGKTVQTIAYLLLMAKNGASLVVAPASVVPNWQRELRRFAPALNVSILNESTDRQQTINQAGKFDILLSTYGLLVSEADALTGKEWNVICLDEAHTIKNRETKTSACAMKLKSANRLILTGTPIQNHLGELWNLFQFINPGLLGSYEQFQQKYILPIEQAHDKQRQLQLNRIVHPFMLRRTKQEVVEELPDKQEIILPIELSEDEMRIYEVIRRKAQKMVAEGGAGVNVNALAEITKLRQAACSASLVEKKWKGECSKIDRLIELLGELKEGSNRALIFSQFTSFLALVQQALEKTGEEFLYLDGSTTMKQREQLVQEFQQGDCPFFLISLKAGGLGLNLTGANYIIHLDPWWNPAIEQQATDRAYRIGQEQKVTAYHLVATHTIEEKIMRLHDTKRNLADALLEGTDMSHKLTAKELMEMLEGK